LYFLWSRCFVWQTQLKLSSVNKFRSNFVTFYDVLCKSVACFPRWNVLAERGTWGGSIQRFADLRVPPLLTSSSRDNIRRFDLICYLLYIHYLHTFNTNILYFGRWRPFLLGSKLHILFSLSTFTVGFPLLLFNSRRIHWSSVDSYVR